jgi:hypothetical protein
VLTSIPIISPIELKLGEPEARRLPPPDYEIDALPPAAVLGVQAQRDPATMALDEIENAAQISEYHDFSWWDERVRIIREQLARDADRLP